MNYSNYKINIAKLEEVRFEKGYTLQEFTKFLNISLTNYYRMRQFGGLCTYKVFKKIDSKIENAARTILKSKRYKWKPSDQKVKRGVQ